MDGLPGRRLEQRSIVDEGENLMWERPFKTPWSEIWFPIQMTAATAAPGSRVGCQHQDASWAGGVGV